MAREWPSGRRRLIRLAYVQHVETRDRARVLAVDLALGALVVGVVGTAIAADLGSTTGPPATAYAFAVGLGALMLVRRRWPVATLLVTAAALLGYYALDFPPVGLAVPVAAALYSAAEAGRLRCQPTARQTRRARPLPARRARL
jgi:hypothetical protein